MKAKVAFLHKPYDLRITIIDVPAPAPNQVLIKVGACGICGSDVECFEGKSKEGRWDIAPYTPGHEWSGLVVEVGKDVKTLKPGYKVTGDCVLACGVCQNCKDGLMPSACINMREIGFRPDSPGGMGEYMLVEEQYVHRIPDDWTYEMGAWVETFSIGYFGIWGNGGFIDASDIAFISGSGPIGLSATIVAKTSGAFTIVSEPNPWRREWAEKYGADLVLDPTDKDFKEKLLTFTNGRGPSLMVEASGNDTAIASVFDLAGHSCRVNFIGHSIGRKVPAELGWIIWKTLCLKGSGGTKDFGQRTIRFMSAIRDKYDFDALNTHKLPFEKLDEAMDLAVNHKDDVFKVMLKFGI
jgi:L-iditol 2-dehydrogenase